MNQGQWRTMDQSDYTGGDQDYFQPPSQDQMMDDVQHGEDGEAPKKKKPWERLGPDGRPIKRKPNPARKNAIFRKALQPKSSIMCLNELQSGLKYVTEPVATVGNYCVSVEVNGQTFRGYGSTKDLAKQAAAEAALVSYVKPPPVKSANGEAPKPEDDTTPWRTLASFAMYKLFSDWRDGRIGMCNAAGQQGFVPGMGMSMQGMQGMQGFQMMQQQQQQQQTHAPVAKEETGGAGGFSNVSAHLTRSVHPAATTVKAKGVVSSTIEMPGPAGGAKPISEKKQNTERQQTCHPVMILHQLCPAIKYTSVEGIDPETNGKQYTVTAEINGQQFSESVPATIQREAHEQAGKNRKASAIKKAKFMLAKTALKALYDIDNVYAAP